MASPEFYRSKPGKKESLWEIRSILQKRTMIFFTILILLASLLSGLAIYHNNRGEVQLSTEQKVDLPPRTGDTAVDMTESAKHGELEDSITVISIAIVVVLVLFMLFIRIKVITPLHRLEELSRRMADGRLDLLFQDNHKTSSYVDTIGENVNSLAMNLQEILLLVWNLSEHNLGTVEETIEMVEDRDTPHHPEEIKANLEQMKTELQQMQALAQQFELFDVTLKGKKARAKEDSANS